MYETGDYVKFLYDQYEIAEGGEYSGNRVVTAVRGTVGIILKIGDGGYSIKSIDGPRRVYGVAEDSVEKISPLELLGMQAE